MFLGVQMVTGDTLEPLVLVSLVIEVRDRHPDVRLDLLINLIHLSLIHI